MALVPASSHGVDTSQANTWTANQTAPAWIASGLTGATAASRYVGATTSGAPGSGTFAVGDFIVDRGGSFWVCTIAGSPGTWVNVANYTPQTTQTAQYVGNNTSIANNASANITVNTLSVGATLLDLTSPSSPAVVTAGIYGITADVQPAASMSANGLFLVSVTIEPAGNAYNFGASSPPAVTASLRPHCTVSFTAYFGAGVPFRTNVTNKDGTNSVNFTMASLLIQRIT